MSDGPDGPAKKSDEDIKRLLELERRYLGRARKARTASPSQGKPPPPESETPAAPGMGPPRDFCGLALSGGGMRSATFNLGLLQGLHQLGLLGMFDYLATVSGGGYIGGFWTAWRHYHAQKPCPGAPKKDGLFPEEDQRSRGTHLPEVRHLREFSNFLSPRLGLLSPDTGRMIVAVLSALIPSLLAALSLIVLSLLLWLVLAHSLIIGWPAAEASPPGWKLALSHALMLVLTAGTLFGCEELLRRQRERVLSSRGMQQADIRDSLESESSRLGYYVPTALLAISLAQWLWHRLLDVNHVNAWHFQGMWLLAPLAPGVNFVRERLYVFAPALAWLGAAGVLVLLRWLGSRFVTEWMQRTELAAVDRVLSRLLILATFWSVLAVFWLGGRFLRDLFLTSPGLQEFYSALKTGLVGSVVALMALFAKVQQFLGRRTSTPVSPKMKHRARAWLPQVLAYAILMLLVLGMVLFILGTAEEKRLPWLVGGAVLVTVLTLLFFDSNLVGLHTFYRARLARTFIGAAHGEAPGQTEPHSKDDFRLHLQKAQTGPLHLICCAANDLASQDPIANLYRGADSAVLSCVGFSVGSEYRTWTKIRKEGGLVPTLASTMTASGAAFNSHMGSMSMRLGPAVTFLMTAFNLRLGLWLPHPTRRTRMRWYERLCVGLPFYRELLGRSRVHSHNVLLSDGGHFENLALYELVRRRCRFIVVSDCGMDAEASFNDFANAVRRVREDFGAEIRIDLSRLRACKDKPATQSVVAGDIEYPDGNTGVLLLVKPVLLGNEPADITQYKASNSAFPHETTGDQFYDEAQWESYRRLGEHVALNAFRPILGELESAEPLAPAQLFARARYEWLPVPEGFAERFPRIVDRATSLDSMLQSQEARKLFGEIFKEINELDLQAKRLHESKRVGNPWPSRGGKDDSGAVEEIQASPQELSDALHMIRRALLLMEEVFLTEDLATHYNHPAYMGLFNYFARWAYAPLVRTWWPLLKTLYSPRFTHFLEERFSLPNVERSDIGQLSGMMMNGFAMSCWKEQGGRDVASGEKLISYQLQLPHGGKNPYHIQAAQLIVRTHHHQGKPLRWKPSGGPEKKVVVWQGDDFYVPPGLWGAGIGEDFLRLVSSSPSMSQVVGTLEEGTYLAVRFQVNREVPPARRKRWADDLHLYRSQGFSEPNKELRDWLEQLKELDEHPAMPWKKQESQPWQRHWLTRVYLHEKEKPAQPGDTSRAGALHPPEPSGYGEPLH